MSNAINVTQNCRANRNCFHRPTSNFSGSGELYDVADAVRFETGLADAVNALVRDPERAHTFGQAGRRRCIDEFSWMQVAQQTLDIYRSVCG